MCRYVDISTAAVDICSRHAHSRARGSTEAGSVPAASGQPSLRRHAARPAHHQHTARAWRQYFYLGHSQVEGELKCPNPESTVPLHIICKSYFKEAKNNIFRSNFLVMLNLANRGNLKNLSSLFSQQGNFSQKIY